MSNYDSHKIYEIGFIGAGNMAQAIGLAFVKKGICKAENILVSAPSENNKKPWRDVGVAVTSDNNAVFCCSKIVILATKPQYFQKVVSGLFTKTIGLPLNILISIMAGITLSTLHEMFDLDPSSLFKVMPNTPSLIGQGFSVIAHMDNADSKKIFENLPTVKYLMGAVGGVEVIPESLMNAAGAVSGSGPAYAFLIIEALADGAVKQGIPRDLAVRLAASAIAGGSLMVLETGKHTGQLKDMVTSAGGSTIAALHALERGGVRSAMMDAIEAATNRWEKMGEKK
ncbi:Pyrroline-5-carboxylate reductase, catalytic, N-terminal,NAD(P)-binding domain,Pyrroline-5-carboxylate [Cinara cedri]|uniref:pyrroline-5-carboxylate reductase n=1 Tax=Cinara cedri TaxID=506608 RepID=A0A5E4MGP7_9HEMI|nr:Pyrroline-5-carboxylate reductase, catalytic, N-terminal,NAD(P)-binding domain,Pyrroline-5-carboxylate [Cinara cedri]